MKSVQKAKAACAVTRSTGRGVAVLFLLLVCAPTFCPRTGKGAEQAGTRKPYLPIRLLDLWTYGDSIARWIEAGSTTFAQIHWVNANLSRYDFRPEEKPKEFLTQVETARARLKTLADRAHKVGLLVYLNEYELNFPDFIARQSLLPAAARGRFMEDKLHEIFVQCPWLDGYMITPTESKLGAGNPEELKAVVLGAQRGMKLA